MSDSDAVDAFAHHVIGEASGCGEHTSCANGCDDSTDHDGPSSAEVASCEACKSSAESYEKGCHSDDGLLRCGERTFWVMRPVTGLWTVVQTPKAWL